MIKSESNIKRVTYKLVLADPFADFEEIEGKKINHILKFHPGDREPLDGFGNEWRIRREVPPKPSENEDSKSSRRKKNLVKNDIEPDMVLHLFCSIVPEDTLLTLMCRAGNTTCS